MYRFYGIVSAQRAWMVLGILLGTLVVCANTMLMALSGWFIASMAVSGSTGAAFNFFFPSAGIRFLAITRTVGRYAERLVTHEATFRVLAGLRVWLFRRLEPLAPAVLERFSGGDVAGRLRSDVDALENLYLRIAAPLISGMLSILASVLLLYWFSPAAALVLLIFLLVAAIALPLYVGWRASKPGAQSALLAAELRNRVADGLQGMEEIILLGVAEQHAVQIEEASANVVSQQEILARITALAQGGMLLLSGTAVAAVLLTCVERVSNNQLSPPQLVMIVLFSAAVFEAAGQFPPSLAALSAVRESAARIFGLADSPAPVPEYPSVFTLPLSNDIQFSSVTASYLPGEPVLAGCSFAVSAGECVVITGHSGIGKSLLLEILVRFRAYSGSVCYGGVEISSFPKDLLLSAISVLPQQPHLFNGTIRQNIMLGNPEATGQQLELALFDSALDAWVSTLPDGLETLVGIGGSSVSGGEARRIALARALLKEAPVILLDEPTEGLDAETEQLVLSRMSIRFKSLSLTPTVLIVSHRPACSSVGRTIDLRRTSLFR